MLGNYEFYSDDIGGGESEGWEDAKVGACRMYGTVTILLGITESSFFVKRRFVARLSAHIDGMALEDDMCEIATPRAP